MPNESGRDHYDVGFGKPPKKSQFQAGKSGNPNGRPRGSQNINTLFHEISRRTIKVKDNEGTRYVSKIEAALTQLANKAASGDLKAVKELIRLTQSMPDLKEALKPQVMRIVFVDSKNGRELTQEEFMKSGFDED